MFGILIQLIVSGIAMGFIYALVGIEYTLIWNASGVLNFSHDKMITTGAYIFGGTYILGLGMDFIPGILLSLITVALLGIVVARVIFIPLRNMTMIYTIMATVMLGKIIVEAIRLLWGPVPFSVPGFLIGTVKVGDVVISILDDGAGFDPLKIKDDGRTHIGIENVRQRVMLQCGGTMHIESKKGCGTTVKIILPQKGGQS